MRDLIKALEILGNYANPNDDNPTLCEHDVLYVYGGVDPDQVSEDDLKTLNCLGFIVDNSLHYFKSYRFGSY